MYNPPPNHYRFPPVNYRKKEGGEETGGSETETPSIHEKETSEGIITGKRVIIGMVIAALGGSGLYGITKLSGPKKLPAAEIEKIRSDKKDFIGKEEIFSKNNGGEFFSFSEIPGMSEVKPKAKYNVYYNIPEEGQNNTAIIHFHGGGGQYFDTENSKNLMNCLKDYTIPIIIPQNAPTKRRGEKSFEIFNDPRTIANLIAFLEGQTGIRVKRVMITAHSEGIKGVANALKSMQKPNEEHKTTADDMYSRIVRIMLFDAADGAGNGTIGNWMHENSNATLFSDYNTGGYRKYIGGGSANYKHGNEALRKKFIGLEISEDRYHIKAMEKGASSHAIIPGECKLALEETPGLEKTEKKEEDDKDESSSD